MTTLAEPGTAALATTFGLLMAAAAAVGTHGLPLAVAAAAVIAVGVGIVFRAAATVAVLLAVATIVLAGPQQLLVAMSGLCAAAYLVCRYAVGPRPAAVLGSWPTIAAAVGFTFAGVVATSFPVQIPWLPLVAPLAVLTIYVVATRPFLN